MGGSCRVISHESGPRVLAPSLPPCFGGRGFSPQAALSRCAPSFPASGSGGSPRVWRRCLCSREDRSLAQGAPAVGSAALPASAAVDAAGSERHWASLKDPGLVRRNLVPSVWDFVNAPLCTRERAPAAFAAVGPGGPLRPAVAEELPLAGMLGACSLPASARGRAPCL